MNKSYDIYNEDDLENMLEEIRDEVLEYWNENEDIEVSVNMDAI